MEGGSWWRGKSEEEEEEGSRGGGVRGGGGAGGTSGDLPQQRAVNQSDLGRTGTHLVTAPRQHLPWRGTMEGGVGRVVWGVRDPHLIGAEGHKKMDRWAQNEEIA